MAHAGRKSALASKNHNTPILVRDVMTDSPYSVDKDESAWSARDLMARLTVHHLPVSKGGKLIGVLSESELTPMLARAALDPDDETVEDAMTSDVLVVAPEAPVKDVVTDMAKQRRDCAVVVERGTIVGIFTVTNALELLGTLV